MQTVDSEIRRLISSGSQTCTGVQQSYRMQKGKFGFFWCLKYMNTNNDSFWLLKDDYAHSSILWICNNKRPWWHFRELESIIIPPDILFKK